MRELFGKSGIDKSSIPQKLKLIKPKLLVKPKLLINLINSSQM